MLPFQLVPASFIPPQTLVNIYQSCEDFIRLGSDNPIDDRILQQDLDYSECTGGQFLGIRLSTGEWIGVLDYIPSNFNDCPNQAFITLLMLSKAWRSKGYGKAVLNQVESIINLNPQVKSIKIAVQINNPIAVIFWQNQGYIQITKPELQSDGTITCLYEKLLDK